MVKISSEVRRCFKSFGGSCACVLIPSEVITNLYSEIFLMRRDVDSFIFYCKERLFFETKDLAFVFMEAHLVVVAPFI